MVFNKTYEKHTDNTKKVSAATSNLWGVLWNLWWLEYSMGFGWARRNASGRSRIYWYFCY